MRVFHSEHNLGICIIILVIIVSCGDNCKFKYQENLEIELDNIKDRNLISTYFVNSNNDTIRKTNNNRISISGGKEINNENVKLIFRLGKSMINGKIIIIYNGNHTVLENLNYELFTCDPGMFERTKDYIEFRSFKFNGTVVNLVENNDSQSFKSTIKL
jgi:hypothetical protein